MNPTARITVYGERVSPAEWRHWCEWSGPSTGMAAVHHELLPELLERAPWPVRVVGPWLEDGKFILVARADGVRVVSLLCHVLRARAANVVRHLQWPLRSRG